MSSSSINIDNGNDLHTNLLVNNNSNTMGISDINVQKNSSIGLDLLVNKNKTGEVNIPNIKEVKIEEPTIQSISTNSSSTGCRSLSLFSVSFFFRNVASHSLSKCTPN